MSEQPRRYKVIVVELLPGDDSFVQNDAAVEAVADRTELEHDLGTFVEVKPASTPVEVALTPAAIGPDAARDHASEERIRAQNEPKLQELLASHVALAGARAIEAAAEMSEAWRIARIHMHLEADRLLCEAVAGLLDLLPDGREVARDLIKQGICTFIVAVALAMGVSVVS